jgi:DNA ligase-1
MKLPILYKKAQTGATRHWTVEISDTGYRAIYGQVDGKTTVSEWYLTEATNVGRANERNIAQQAQFEAEALWQKKKDSGYTTEIGDINKKPAFVKPMLADTWEKRQDKVKFPVFSQPKLDGMRAVMTKDGAFTRNGKKWVTVPHILAQLQPIFDLYPDLILDGELYNHDFKDDFNKISSLAKKTKPTNEDLQETAKLLQYWVYDVTCSPDASDRHKMPSSTFADRRDFIQNLFNTFECPAINVVETVHVSTQDLLDDIYCNYLEKGYEGQMIRLDTLYERKRSKSLMKRKTFYDEEYKIVSVEEGNGKKKGMVGYMFLEREDGVQFRSNIKGSHEFLQELFERRDELVDKYATCRFPNLTPDGIPRFPYVVKIRDGKGID